jgi:phage baseplate assembly protein gpV
VIEETLGKQDADIAELKRKYYGVVTGTVINPLDPLMLGRVQVQLPFIDSLDLSPWARVATPMAGPASGFYFLPNVGDEVLVAFEHGDVNAPYVIGSLWGAMAPPPLPSPVPQIRTLRTLAGVQVILTEIPPSVTIMTPTGQTILMSPAGIQITAGTDVINMTPDGITLHAPNVNIVADAAVSIVAGTALSVSAGAGATVTAGGTASITAPLVRINS